MLGQEGKKNITIKDVADKAGVSYATVSRALNDRKDISTATKEKVLRIANEIGYRPNAIARSLVNKHSHSIALIVPDISYSFFSEIAFSAEDEAAKRGYSMFLGNSRWNAEAEARLLESISEKRVDGILLHSVGENLIDYSLLEIPSVLIGLSGPENISSVQVDNFSGGEIGTKHLIEKGYKKIACLTGNSKLNIYNERINGYVDALSTSSIKINEPIVFSGFENSEDSYRFAKTCLIESDAPDAFFCGNDLMALGVWQAISELGLKVSDDVGICGFDNSEAARSHQIQLTSVAQPLQEIGQKAAELLFEQIQSPNSEALHCTLPVELIARKTSRGPV